MNHKTRFSNSKPTNERVSLQRRYLIQHGARDGDRRCLQIARLVPIVGRVEDHLALADRVLCSAATMNRMESKNQAHK